MGQQLQLGAALIERLDQGLTQARAALEGAGIAPGFQLVRKRHVPVAEPRGLIGIQTGMALNSIRIASEQRKVFTSIISTLVGAVEMRDPALKGSSKRVSRFAKAIAKALSLPHEDTNSVALAALLHNIGRLSISEADIFHSQSAKTREETLEYKQAMRTEELMRNIEGLREILPAVKHSFEKYDGSGYPNGIQGDQLSLFGRISSIVDIYDALTTVRSYKKAFTPFEALSILKKNEGDYDNNLLREMVMMLGRQVKAAQKD